MALCVRIMDHFRFLLEPFGIDQGPIPFYSDSKVAIDLINRGYMSASTRHLLISFHTVKEAQDAGHIRLVKIPGEDNPADLFTKALPRVTHEKHTATVLNDSIFD